MKSLAALVLGAGVNGLSVASELLRRGWGVTVWAEHLPSETTSAVAAGIWYPVMAAVRGVVMDWGRRSYEAFLELARSDPSAGVRVRGGLELFHRPTPDPWWGPSVLGFRRPLQGELPPGYPDGVHFLTPVVEMDTYLPYLARRVVALGGRLERHRAGSLEEALAACPVVVNCMGLGAAEVAGDAQLSPIRGQLVRVSNPGVDRFLIDEASMTYVVPRDRDCILGGTADAGEWDLTPSPEVARSILERCQRLELRLSGARVLGHRVGLRPWRPSVRLEREGRPGGVVVSNYGHGGSGVTLSVGCAEEVADLLGAVR